MSRLKEWIRDFPGQNGAVVVALLLILLTGLVVVGKLTIGQVFPDGYDTWIWALVALAGVNVAGMGIKRVTDYDYKKAGTPAVNVETASQVNVTKETQAPLKPSPTEDP